MIKRINQVAVSQIDSALLTRSDSILQRAFIENVGGEGTEGWVHTVLNLQTDWTNPQNNQTLKQRLGQTCFSSLFTHYHRAQLAVITHQNQLRKKGH